MTTIYVVSELSNRDDLSVKLVKGFAVEATAKDFAQQLEERYYTAYPQDKSHPNYRYFARTWCTVTPLEVE